MPEPARTVLTRDTIEGDFIRRMLQESGLPYTIRSDAELEQSLEATLRQRPGGPVMAGEDVWLFAYGSLIWNPAFEFREQATGTIHSWHRRFCLSTPMGRGSPQHPGLVLGLDRGGSCRGVAFRIAAHKVRRELQVVWRREMIADSYLPRWANLHVNGEKIPTIAFTINPMSGNYQPKITLAETADRIAVAAGDLGSSADYLFNTVAGLEAAGIADVWLTRLKRLVEERLEA
jgi:glutathione-specific gamma-glutamylcyclotransferase